MNDITIGRINSSPREINILGNKRGRTAMLPFWVDSSWYEHYWWRNEPPRRRWLLPVLIRVTARIGRLLAGALWFVGYVFILILSGNFRPPRYQEVRQAADQKANATAGTINTLIGLERADGRGVSSAPRSPQPRAAARRSDPRCEPDGSLRCSARARTPAA